MKFGTMNFIGIFICLLIAPALKADTIVLTQGPYSSGAGGEFTATTSANGVFNTFCLEYGEHFYPGRTYTYSISDRAIQGGPNTQPGAVPGEDIISVGTAWLYRQFAQHTLANYFTGTEQANAGLLQNTIWWLEDERTDPGNSNPFRAAVYAAFANPKIDFTGSDVRVMNITDPTRADGLATIYRQDQLIYTGVPDGGNSLVLLGMALAGLAFIPAGLRRRASPAK